VGSREHLEYRVMDMSSEANGVMIDERAGGRVMTLANASGKLALAAKFALVILLVIIPWIAGAKIPFFLTGLALVVIFLSLGLLIKTSRQVSLCQLAFAAIGASAFSHLHSATGMPWLAAMLLAGLIVIPVGALLAVPAIRLSGIFLALATLGFGILVQQMFYSSDLMFGVSGAGTAMPRPHLASITLDSDRGYYYVLLLIVAVASVLVSVIVRTRAGRLLRALGDSPRALVSLGLDTQVLCVLVFCISAFLAAEGGVLLGCVFGTVTGASYDPYQSLTYLAVVVIVTGRAPWYAFVAASGFAIVPALFTSATVPQYLQLVFGASALLTAVLFRRQDAANPVPVVPESPPPAATEAAAVTSERPRTPIPAAPGLLVEGLSVAYGGIRAVSDVTLQARRGTITGLIGPNGAGKTSLFNACSGFVRPGTGTVSLGGRPMTRLRPDRRARLGLGRTFQQSELFDSLTVGENIALGAEAAIAGRSPLRQLISTRGQSADIRAAAGRAARQCGVDSVLETKAGLLSTGLRRRVELARCLAGSFQFVMLDEPSSGLDRLETQKLGSVLRHVADNAGLGFLLIEHDMSLVMNVCDYIYVIDFGRLIFEGSPDEVRASELVQGAYLGSLESPTSQ
jgi:ABC-type branched-subunit amino acid transport system ATPase component/ABC-type branched-subunit amino acid transport system permease subunit